MICYSCDTFSGSLIRGHPEDVLSEKIGLLSMEEGSASEKMPALKYLKDITTMIDEPTLTFLKHRTKSSK